MAFSDIYGHEKQILVLQQAMRRNRIPHAYLFYGMPGIGKRSIAFVFAKALNCEVCQDDACDRCISCRKADHRNHPDLRIIEPAGQSIRIAEVRELQEQMMFKPLDGKRRIFIVDEAEKMNGAAANALLKTLEEPTPSNILILIASRPYLLPLTILSRCQPLRFSPLNRETVGRYLQERCAISPETARLLAASSGGSIGRAMEMNDEDYLALRNQVLEQVMERGAPIRIFSMAAAFGQDRKGILQRLDVMKICFRDALVYKETGSAHDLFNQDRVPEILSLAGGLSVKDLLRNIRTVERAYRAIDQNANKSLTLETMMFRLASKS